MNEIIDFSKQRTSWTKYDIVQVMEVIDSIQTLQAFKSGRAVINEAILKSFLGITSLDDPIPQYWFDIQNHPKEKKIFALFAALFTHGGVIKEFAEKYSKGNMRGVFIVEQGKQYTNIRSGLIESGVAKSIYRRTKEVPYDFSPIFENSVVGTLFKNLLFERLSRFGGKNIEEDFYKNCYYNNFHKAISLSKSQFKLWLEGGHLKVDLPNKSNYVESIYIEKFFSVEKTSLNFAGSKEIYFLGENGDGKSLILMALYLGFNGYYVMESTDLEETGRAADLLRNNKDIQLSGIDSKGQNYNPQKDLFLKNFYAYGTHRGRTSTDNPEVYGFMSLFDSEKMLINPVSWLKDQKLLELQKNSDQGKASLGYKDLPYSFPIELLKKMFHNLLDKNVEIKIEGSGVTFIEKGSILNFDQLSEGYKSILIFVSDLLYRLSRNISKEEKTMEFKGIVIVDEIDLHLHPKWQRIIISKLRLFLPKVQFIFSTHSPNIIQGASDDAIMFRVYRNNEDGKTRVSEPYLRKKLDHLMINSLLTSPLFGLEDSRMNTEDNNSDTSETYLLSRINRKLEIELEKKKAHGQAHMEDNEIDEMIQLIINQELGNHD